MKPFLAALGEAACLAAFFGLLFFWLHLLEPVAR